MGEQRSWPDLVSELRDWADIGLQDVQAKKLDRGLLGERFTSIRDLATRALQMVPIVPPEPAPPPEPEPTPPPTPAAAYLGFAVTYAGHDPARDVYLGLTPDQKEWGRHDGLPVLAPGPGRVELYQFPTPLNLPAAADPDYVRHYDELFREPWICMAPPPFHQAANAHLIGSQAMFVAVYWPDAPIHLSNGQTLKAAWFGHCKGDIAVGRVNTGDRICTSYNSGINFEANGITARAAHVHTCGSATGVLSMNGDVDGLLVAQALGWQVEYRGANGPGPDQYMAGGFVAGKPKSQWVGHQIPPVPN
jgi:hypothetical protein